MSLAARCKDFFLSGDWSRGSTYFHARRVKIDDHSDKIVRARVRGSSGNSYEVVVDWSASFRLSAAELPAAVSRLLQSGWKVEGQGKQFRSPGSLRLSVASGTDWFDLSGECDFQGQQASLPELIKAMRCGQQFVELGDGTRGILPQQWLERCAPLADLGQANGAVLRFAPAQAAILDALLAVQSNVAYDAAFVRVRRKLGKFDGIAPRHEPRGFCGTLREYQREGLGWLHFLREFNFGGCLADDMGLGKTVQALALLEERRTRRVRPGQPKAPSLVVVPRSLVFNWLEESRRFTPRLRTLDYSHKNRGDLESVLAEYDLLITTYGVLRRDITQLGKVRFDYVILDEAQAIKNAHSQAAKACRLLQGDHRLAMTGTPIENHLGELWSLFEFLNPGMVGQSGRLASLLKGGDADRESLALLRNALRPYLLRRTKQQVLTELPQKTEQTLMCELGPRQRKLYVELRDHYRDQLRQRIDKVGLKRAKIHVLEALLRLRQAACHPGLVDKRRGREPSAKLEILLEQLREVLDEGHKVLIFSQFTSMLALVREALDREKMVYEYLDGRARNRQSRVERFQSDPECRLFLISMKAGGHGLNLTAADYVFLLDPWWNPAVEAQAVDRAHRIGQGRPVFAYRLIAQDTVEEKILQLQKQKRELAEAIVTGDDRLLSNLTADDLRLLLS
jgi:SNF2 family DNA or RNA helicase